jgi:heme-degrading monooxygenase HmoA
MGVDADGPSTRPTITVFRSWRRPGNEAAYDTMAEATEAAARAMPGFIELKTFTADDGEHVTISVFDTPESQEAWRTHPLHLEAQSLGRTTFYSAYDLTIAEVTHRHRWSRSDTPSEANDD